MHKRGSQGSNAMSNNRSKSKTKPVKQKKEELKEQIYMQIGETQKPKVGRKKDVEINRSQTKKTPLDEP